MTRLIPWVDHVWTIECDLIVICRMTQIDAIKWFDHVNVNHGMKWWFVVWLKDFTEVIWSSRIIQCDQNDYRIECHQMIFDHVNHLSSNYAIKLILWLDWYHELIVNHRMRSNSDLSYDTNDAIKRFDHVNVTHRMRSWFVVWLKDCTQISWSIKSNNPMRFRIMRSNWFYQQKSLPNEEVSWP